MALVVIAVLLLALPLHDLIRKPTFRRLAFRNLVRRKGEAVLVVLGAMLGTAIITASFLVADTLNATFRDSGRTKLGPVDEVVGTPDLAQLDEVERAVSDPPVEGTDGTLRSVHASAAASAGTGDARRVEPNASIVEVDFDAAREFGSDPGITGMTGAGPTPAEGEAVLAEDLAGRLEVDDGDTVEVFAYGTSRTLRVRQTLEKVGVAGYDGRFEPDSHAVFVAPGTIADLVTGGIDGLGEQVAPPDAEVLVSNVGGVFDGVDLSDEVKAVLDQRVGNLGAVQVQTVKQDLVDRAEDESQSIGELFTGIGFFSVIAGILLLINIFVMLAEERKTEFGMIRAIGLKRNHLVRAFGFEGALYAILASAVGVLLGILVARAIVQVTQGIFEGDSDIELAFRFTVHAATMLQGFLVGLVISMVTIWATVLRISRLNVIRAIRDLPEPKVTRQRTRTAIAGAVGVVVGGLLFSSGVSGNAEIPALLGPAVALWSAVPLLGRILPRRVAVTVLCGAALAWGILAFSIIPDVLENPGIELFVVQGIVLVASAVALAITNDHGWVTLADRLGRQGRGLAARLGFAYPLDRRFRTGLLLGMYALVIFTLVFLAVFSAIFERQGPQITDDIRAGQDVLVQANSSNPPSRDVLLEQPGVTDASPLLYSFVEWVTPESGDPEFWSVSGFDEGFLEHGQPKLSERDADYASDREAYEAVLADPELAVVPSFFLQGGGPPESTLEPGQTVTMIEPGTDHREVLTIAGIIDSDFVFNGVMVSAESLRSFLGPRAVADRFYVSVEPGADADEVATRLEARLLANGVEADSFRSLVDEQLATQNGFFRLMQGYLGLGLLIGIAGLGVVMVRAVRERRRQIGMLRAMGFRAAVVRRAFLIEATFIAVQGLVIGVLLGLLSSYQLLTQSDTFGDSNLSYVIPWLALVLVIVVPLAASLFAVAAPATQAARIKPAVALRIAD